MTQAIILAGGLGTRLQPVIHNIPKPMAPIRGRPFLAFILDHLSDQSIDHVILSVGYRHEVILDYFGTRYKSLHIDYSIEETPLGTGGAIRQALEYVTDDKAFCLNGDTFLKLDYGKALQVHQEQDGTMMTLVLKKENDVSRYGTVTIKDNGIISFQEKHGTGKGLINAGHYILSKTLFDEFKLPKVFSFENDFLHPFCHTIHVRQITTDGSFIDIGIPEDYQRANREL
ncbi:MAG: nucleotidyltransferase family protein [Nitrospirales bacterium]